MNDSINTGIFPAIWKQRKVIPTFKKGARSDPMNYRPVCQMSVLGKLLELIILKQVEPFIDSCLPDQMHGFRNNKGTESALVTLLDQIKELKSRSAGL